VWAGAVKQVRRTRASSVKLSLLCPPFLLAEAVFLIGHIKTPVSGLASPKSAVSKNRQLFVAMKGH
jgi:hypothetical protein